MEKILGKGHHLSDPALGNQCQCFHTGAWGNPLRCSHRRESQVVKKQNLPYIKKSENSWSADRAIQGEQEAFSKLSEAEFHTRILLEEQRNHILSQTRYECLWQHRRAEKAESSIQHVGKQFLTGPTENGRIESAELDMANFPENNYEKVRRLELNIQSKFRNCKTK